MTAETKTLPSVWLGCLACYSSARLVGDWVPASEAAEFPIEKLHRDHGISNCDGEELWVMDTDDMPVQEEMSPQRAQQWADILDEVGESHADALRAWIASGTQIVHSDDLPCVEDFFERYQGEYDDWRDFVEHAACEMDILDKMPEHLHCYFDFDKWGRDLAFDYSTEDAAGGGLHVFATY